MSFAGAVRCHDDEYSTYRTTEISSGERDLIKNDEGTVEFR